MKYVKTGELKMERKVGGHYRDQYFDKYMDYLREQGNKKAKEAGKQPYAESTIKTWATDTFFLEKHEERDFKEWLVSDASLEEARKALVKHFTGHRNNPETDAEYYVHRMIDFKPFLGL